MGGREEGSTSSWWCLRLGERGLKDFGLEIPSPHMDPHPVLSPQILPGLLGIWEGASNPGQFGAPPKNFRTVVLNLMAL